MTAQLGSLWTCLATSLSIPGMMRNAKPARQATLATDRTLSRLVQVAFIVWVVVPSAGSSFLESALPTAHRVARRTTQSRLGRIARRSAWHAALVTNSYRPTRGTDSDIMV